MKLQLPPDLSFEMSISVLLGQECLESWPVAILLHGLTSLVVFWRFIIIAAKRTPPMVVCCCAGVLVQ